APSRRSSGPRLRSASGILPVPLPARGGLRAARVLRRLGRGVGPSLPRPRVARERAPAVPLLSPPTPPLGRRPRSLTITICPPHPSVVLAHPKEGEGP